MKLGPRPRKIRLGAVVFVLDKTKEKISNAMKGCQNALGRIISEETREKLSNAKIGQTRSEETRRKISISLRKYWSKIREEEYRMKKNRR